MTSWQGNGTKERHEDWYVPFVLLYFIDGVVVVGCRR